MTPLHTGSVIELLLMNSNLKSNKSEKSSGMITAYSSHPGIQRSQESLFNNILRVL